ncbi:hypothetical protein [Actinomyces sp. MRS3W]|uniref:hypothetical protein n=1 Tax=Actinomyces sp. MRS3W TaxID=2800796 RepID=UPI0028FD56DC|nr:hypothetical protein [Actinomyces sp. MRS3W]MDU0348779.1 hypothetical protein [Actinomyces sp. MRS3W]
MAGYETDDGEPRYGKRLSPEELAAYLREQGIEPRTTAQAPDGEPENRRRDTSRAAGRAPRSAAARGAATRSTRRWRTLVVGLVLMFVVPLVLSVAGVLTVLDGSLAQGAQLSEDGVVYLEKGTTAALYGTTPTATADCTVTGPDDVAVILQTPGEGLPYLSFAVGQTGAYTVTCPAGTRGMVVGPAMNLDRVPLAGTLILAGSAAGLAGIVVTIIGLVRLRR